MKNQFILFTLFIAIAFTSCKKDEELVEETTTTPPIVQTRSTLALTPTSNWGSEPFNLNQVYSVYGVDVRFAEIRFYLSNFEIHDMMNNSHDLGGYVLIDAGSSAALDLPGTDMMYAQDISMALGIDSITNHADPTVAEAPLNDPLMHWSWNPDGGYKFMKIEGEHDADMDGTFESFSIHAATDPCYREMSFAVMENLEEGANTFSLAVNYEAFFTNVDFTALEGTHGSSALTNGIADQIQQNALILE